MRSASGWHRALWRRAQYGLVFGLASIGWPWDLSAEADPVELRLFWATEIVQRLADLSIRDDPDGLNRLVKGDGIRIALRSGGVVELRCDGSVTRREMPGQMNCFDAEGSRFAWYEGRELRFAVPRSDDIVGLRALDPNGRYVVARLRDYPEGPYSIYAIRDLTHALITTQLSALVFSRRSEVVVVGRARVSESAMVIVYDLVEGRLVEQERITVPPPDTWFGGTLHPADVTPDGDEILFVFARDPPLSHRLYRFNMARRTLEYAAKTRDYQAYVTCDPLAPTAR